MTAAFAITVLAAAWVITLALLFIVLSGSAQMLDEERELTDRYKAERDAARAARRVVEAALRAEQRAHDRAARGFTSPADLEAIQNQLFAFNESGRADWSQPSSWGDPA